MQISIKENIAAEIGAISDRFARQLPFVIARALTITATQARKDAQAEIRRVGVFDRPTPWIVGSVKYTLTTKAQVKAGDASARVYIDDQPNKSGSTPVITLGPHVQGGSRPMKRFEKAFQALGLMREGEALVPAKDRTDLLDKYGNVKSALLVQLLSYFRAFGQQGYRANSTVKTRNRIARFGRTASGARTIQGAVYFWSRGPGHWTGSGSWQHGREQRLPRGIWQQSGTHGSNVKPVLLVVKQPGYRKRFDFVATVKASVGRTFQPAFATAWADAMRTAR